MGRPGAEAWRGVRLPLLCLLFAASQCHGTSPPSKPVLLGCRSPEKETFTCWWEPGLDGGLPTAHRLYYERERLEGTHECPDYVSAGGNSCFFDQNHTSIWVDYHLTVVASNALGNATSDVLKIDVMEIVKPSPPGNVTLLVEERDEGPRLHVNWEHPRNADTGSGWVTPEYQLRIKQKDGRTWKEYRSGTQTHFTLYSISLGAEYVVQVRCRLDHGSWSEWSGGASVELRRDGREEKPLWILLSAVPFLTLTCILAMKRKSVKQYLLPPVPAPRIPGVDAQLLKKGRSGDVADALISRHGFPPSPTWKDQMEDFLLVCDAGEKLLLPDAPETQRSRRSFIVPAGLPDVEPPCRERPEEAARRMDGVEKQGFLSSYVDIGSPEEHKKVEDEEEETLRANMLEDYSKVKEVDSDNVLFLQKQTRDASYGEKSCRRVKQKPRNLEEATAAAFHPGLLDGGYVDGVPALPRM